jgi:imidazolonepropionase-like amidohydrolase
VASILVRDGRVAAVGAEVHADGVPALDASGTTVLPGLIDAHVHLGVVPGTEFRKDSDDTKRALRRRHLSALLASGVTTVLDAAVDVRTAREVNAWLESGLPGPRYLILGPALAAPGGYMAGAFPTTVVAGPDDVDRALDTVQAAGAIGVKVPLEKGFGPIETLPTHPPAVRDAIARGAAQRGLPIFVHATHEDEQAMALDMGARALVHTSFYDASPSEAFVERLAGAGAFVMTTFSIMDAQLTRWHPERLDDPLVRLVVPALERRTAADPEAGAYLAQHEMALVFPRLPGLAHRALAWAFTTEDAVRGRLESCMAAVKRFYDRGVPLVVGSDAANWDAVPYQFFGSSTIWDLEMIVVECVLAM